MALVTLRMALFCNFYLLKQWQSRKALSFPNPVVARHLRCSRPLVPWALASLWTAKGHGRLYEVGTVRKSHDDRTSQHQTARELEAKV
eukprot:1343262-Amphidinium_carterae.1